MKGNYYLGQLQCLPPPITSRSCAVCSCTTAHVLVWLNSPLLLLALLTRKLLPLESWGQLLCHFSAFHYLSANTSISKTFRKMSVFQSNFYQGSFSRKPEHHTVQWIWHPSQTDYKTKPFTQCHCIFGLKASKYLYYLNQFQKKKNH